MDSGVTTQATERRGRSDSGMLKQAVSCTHLKELQCDRVGPMKDQFYRILTLGLSDSALDLSPPRRTRSRRPSAGSVVSGGVDLGPPSAESVLKAVAEASSDAMAMADRRRVLRWVNSRFECETGYC